MTAKPYFLTISVLLKRRSIALALTVGLLFTVASMQSLGQSRAYVGNLQSVSVIDTDPDSPFFNTVVTTIPLPMRFGVSAKQVAITPDGSRAYITHRTSPATVSVIDTDPDSPFFHTVSAEIPVGGFHLQQLPSRPMGLAPTTQILIWTRLK